MYDLIIVGGGPAGITAGIYASRQNLNTLLITKEFGGQIARKAVLIENYPGFKEISGRDLIKRLVQHLKKFDIEIKRDSVTKIKKKEHFLVKTKEEQFKSKAVLVASGADPRPLEVPGEKKFIGRGVSYCSVCDGMLFSDKKVAVIGGGDAGFESALFLAKRSPKVYILEYQEEVKAAQFNKERVNKNDKIEVITSAALKEIKGDKFVNKVVYEDKKEEKKKELEVEGVFVEIGSQPATSFVKDLVEFNKKDEIKIDPYTCETSTKGLFAAGDVTNIKFKQIAIAVGEGTKAALSAYQYLQKNE